MTKTTPLPKEFSVHMATSGYLYSNTTTETIGSRAGTNFSSVYFIVPPVVIKPSKSKDIDDFIGELIAQQPDLENDLREGRKWVAEALYADQENSLKALRLRVGLSQAELAEKIGMKQPNICELETGKRKPNLDTLRRLSEALETTADEILKSINKVG